MYKRQHQHQVVVGAAADQIEALGHEGLRQGGGVFENLLLVGFELRLCLLYTSRCV